MSLVVKIDEMSQPKVEYRLRQGWAGVKGKQSSAKGPLFALTVVHLCVQWRHLPNAAHKITRPQT